MRLTKSAIQQLSVAERKQRYKENRRSYNKKYKERLHNEAVSIFCACGCGQKLKERDKQGKIRRFIYGHSTQYKLIEWILCGCGCGVLMKKLDKKGRIRKTLKGHSKVRMQHQNTPTIFCRCGCGTMIDKISESGYEKQYVRGHHGKYGTTCEKIKRNTINSQNKARERKRKLIELFGNVCNKCGFEYSGKNAAAFGFHHIIPEEKKFQLSGSNLNLSWDKVLRESKKCILVCANCHELVHSILY